MPIDRPHRVETTEPAAIEAASSGYADPMQTLRNLRQKIESRYSCDQWCQYSCHGPYRMGVMTRWAGSLSVRVQGMPHTGNSCNFQSCKKRSSMRIQVQLGLPSWILSRILVVSILCHSSTILQFNFRTVRVRHGGDAIFIYAQTGNLDVIKTLFTEGKASVFDVDTNNHSALTRAIGSGHYAVGRFLLDQGSDQYLEDRARRSPYMIALETLLFTDYAETQTMIRQLFFRDTENVLCLSRMSNLQLMVSGKMCGDVHKEIELSKNDIDYQDLTGNTALHWAVLHGKTDLVQILLSYGADPMCFNFADLTPLHVAAIWDHKLIPLLLEAGTDPDIRNYHRESPLHKAAYQRHWEPGLYMTPLLDAGANINAQTDLGTTPLKSACHQQGNLKTVVYLIQQGADINLPSHDGYTPIVTAIQWYHSSYVQLLMEAGAECCGDNVFGQNILHIVAGWGDVETMRVLNKWRRRLRGVDIFLKDKWGNTPLDCAMRRRDISEEWAGLFQRLVSAAVECQDESPEPSEDMNDEEWITTDDDGTSEDEYSGSEDAQSSTDGFQDFEDALEVQDEVEEL
ncbi:hypothetical protein IFR05_002610 [Cadophora sp. M221]|nr:hypothetical protein IFR05_002610 [Cadophora sp. M221]